MSTRQTAFDVNTLDIEYADDIGLSQAIPLTSIHSDTSVAMEVQQLDKWAASNDIRIRISFIGQLCVHIQGILLRFFFA